MHVGPAGPLALDAAVTPDMLQAMLAEARDFVADWLELRPVFQHRLHGQCLRPPLQVMCLLSVVHCCLPLPQICREARNLTWPLFIDAERSRLFFSFLGFLF